MSLKKSVSFEDALDKFNSLIVSKGGSLNDVEKYIIRCCWERKSYPEMADNCDHTMNYLQRTVAPKLFKKIGAIFKQGEINKGGLAVIVDRFINQEEFPLDHLSEIRGDILPDVSKFYGRRREISHLISEINSLHNRSVQIYGVAGIGKSTLAAKLMVEVNEEHKSKFNTLIWKFVGYKLLLKDLLAELIVLIDPVYEEFSALPENVHSRITFLIQLIRRKPCLIVLDDFSFPEPDAEYQSFLQRLVEEQHQSCFIFTSRGVQDGVKRLMQSRGMGHLKLEGLNNDAAAQLLSAYGLEKKQEFDSLISKYRGNPSELMALADRITNLYGCEKTFFQNPTTLISNKFESMLDDMFGGRLTQLQQQILTYITKATNELNPEIKISSLFTNFKESIDISSNSEIVKALERLEGYSLIEKKQSLDKEISFSIQPIVKKYISKKILAYG
ncbi:MAG: ATP-binding protein [Cyanobacteria bacterium P01_A01_bin.68]